LAGCAATKGGFSTFSGKLGGVCNAFERPQYQIAGKTPYDQDWADKTTESGIAGCAWTRPEARPASLDAPPIDAQTRRVSVPLQKLAPAKKRRFGWIKSKFGKPE
jgi:hypothetical protein